MPKLPMQQAKDLAATMAKKGLSGSISMDESAPDLEQDKESDSQDEYGLDSCLDDAAEVISSGGSKEEIRDSLARLVEMIKSQDMDADEAMLGGE